MKNGTLKRDLLLSLATGVMVGTSYPPFRAWALLFCLAPLWWSWYRAPSFKNVFYTGFLAQFTLTMIGFNWIAHTAVEYGHLPVILSVFILIGFCLFASLHFVFAGLLVHYFHKKYHLKPLWFYLSLATATAMFEWFYPTIFPWNMGYPLIFNKLQSNQLAEFIGFNGLSLIIFLINAGFSLSLHQKLQKNAFRKTLAIIIIALISLEILGSSVYKKISPDDSEVSALLVQPNIGNYDKYYAERGEAYQQPIVAKNFELTTKGLKESSVPPQLIIWPETAYPVELDPPFQNGLYQQLLFNFARDNKIPFIAGAYSKDAGGPRAPDYNAIFAVTKGGEVLPGYRKHILLAFGEYFPGANWFPWLKTLVPAISDFKRGAGPIAFELNSIRYLPLICYESLDVPYVRWAVAQKGHIIVNLTNDSWFGDNFEPYQNMIMTVARAVEFRLPIIRSTNTGFSIIANKKGEIIHQGPQNAEWTQTVSVPFQTKPEPTVFFFIEPWLSFIFIALCFMTLFLGILKREKPRA